MKKLLYLLLFTCFVSNAQKLYLGGKKIKIQGGKKIVSVSTPVSNNIPTITSAVASNITENSGFISWSASEPITGQIQWEYGNSGIISSGINYNHLTGHTHTIQNLPSDTEITYYLIGRNVEGDSIAVTPRTFTTSAPQAVVYDYNIKDDFEAIGNGTTDDRAAIQNAFNNIPDGTAQNRTVLYIPDGVYRIAKSSSTRLLLDSKNSITIVGESKTGTIIRLDAASELEWGTFIKFQDSDNLVLRNLTIDGNSGPTFFGGGNNVPGNESQGIANLLIDRCDNWIVEDIVHKNSWYNSIQLRDINNGVIQRTIGYNTDC